MIELVSGRNPYRKVLHLKTLKNLSALLLALLLAASFSATAFAEEIPDNPGDGIIEVISPGDTMQVNEGTVTDNQGTIFTNEYSGEVTTNNAGATIWDNEGTVTTNAGPDGEKEAGCIVHNQEFAEVTTNNGTVETNNGTVETNNGTVEVNALGATIETNNGTVETNKGIIGSIDYTESGNPIPLEGNNGTVTDNSGAIVVNTGTVETNNNIVLYNTGTIDTNDGNVWENYGGDVNNGSGKIWTNYFGVSVIDDDGLAEHTGAGFVDTGDWSSVITDALKDRYLVLDKGDDSGKLETPATVTVSAKDGNELEKPTVEGDDFDFTIDGNSSSWKITITRILSNIKIRITGKKPAPAPAPAAAVDLSFNAVKFTFDLDGGTLDGVTGKVIKWFVPGTTVKLPAAPDKDGCTFAGWETSVGGEKKVFEAGEEFTVTGAQSFIALWEVA